MSIGVPVQYQDLEGRIPIEAIHPGCYTLARNFMN